MIIPFNYVSIIRVNNIKMFRVPYLLCFQLHSVTWARICGVPIVMGV